MEASELVFRHAGGCLIESPDLAVPAGAPSHRWRWAATVWTDPHVDDGWGVLEWAAGERGWELPLTTAIGDVIEFGIGWRNERDDIECVRWWGWIERCSARAIVAVGPYDHPLHAANAARSVIDEVRLSQLASPDIIDAVAATIGDSHRLD